MTVSYSSGQLAELSRQIFAGGASLRLSLQHYRPYICPFERLLPLVRQGASLLDVGCGCGLFIGLLLAGGNPVNAIGFDADAGAIAIASGMARHVPAGTPPRFLHLNTNEPWPEGPFDVVALIDVMHHVDPRSQQQVLYTAARRLAPGGILLYKDMSRRPFWKALANRLHDLLLARQWIHYVPIERVETWAGECGLKTVHAESMGRFWYAHELRVFSRDPAAIPAT